MKINIEEEKELTYKDIKQGELFAYCGVIFIKTDMDEITGDNDISVRLVDGYRMTFGDDCQVKRVDGELNVTIIGG